MHGEQHLAPGTFVMVEGIAMNGSLLARIYVGKKVEFSPCTFDLQGSEIFQRRLFDQFKPRGINF